MSKVRTGIVLVGIAFELVALLVALQLRPLLAYYRLDDENWRRTAAPYQLREAAHSALGLWVADPHDAVVVLSVYGDSSSIPYLRRALANTPTLPDGGVLCTWQHAQDALDRIMAETRSEGEKER